MKFVKNHILPLSAAMGGVAVLLLRMGHLATADAHGLLAGGHITGILAWILILLIPALLLWRSLVLSKESTCQFPGSMVSAIGYGIGAAGIAFTSVQFLMDPQSNLLLIIGFVGLVSAAALGIVGALRIKGATGNALYLAAPCLFFMLLLISQYQTWSSVPQLQLYACPLLATVCLILGTYHRACFDCGMGKLRLFTFFRCLCIFFCLAAIPGTKDWILYLTGAVWSAADLLNIAVTDKEGA